MSVTTPGTTPWAPWGGRAGPAGPTDLVVTTGGNRIAVDPEELDGHAAELQLAASLADRMDALLAKLDASVAASAAEHGLLHHVTELRARLAELREGATGLQALAAALRELGADVTHMRHVYGGADSAVAHLFAMGRPWRPLLNIPPPWLPPLILGPVGWGMTYGTAYAGDAAALAGAATATYLTMLRHPAPDGVVVQENIAALAPYMQHMGGGAASGPFRYRGRDIDVSGLDEIQRSALLGLGWLSRATALLGPLLGPQYDRVRAVPVQNPLVPGATWRLPIPHALPTVIGRPVETPRDEAEALARIDAANAQIATHGGGAIEILRTDTSDGARHWTVLVPGTKDVTAGGANPMDNETNFLGVAGQQTDMEIAVAQAMEHAGIAAGEPVSLLGHSQGGIVAARLAADELLQQRYDIRTVVTAGSPTGTVQGIPDSSHVLHLEDSQDPTPGLDGAPNPDGRNRITLTRLGEEPESFAQRHLLDEYVEIAGRLDEVDDPAIHRFRTAAAEAMAFDAEDASTRSYLFEVERY